MKLRVTVSPASSSTSMSHRRVKSDTGPTTLCYTSTRPSLIEILSLLLLLIFLAFLDPRLLGLILIG